MSANDMAEKLARRLRDIMGEFNDDCVGVEILVRQLADYRRAHLTQPAQSVDVAAKDAELASSHAAELRLSIRADLAESRLAAANALLRDIAGCQWFNREAPATVELIDAHLQGAGDEA